MNIRITAYRHSKLGIRSSKDFKSSVRNGNVIVRLSFFLVWLSSSVSILRFNHVAACVITRPTVLPSSTVCSSVHLRMARWVVFAYYK